PQRNRTIPRVLHGELDAISAGDFLDSPPDVQSRDDCAALLVERGRRKILAIQLNRGRSFQTDCGVLPQIQFDRPAGLGMQKRSAHGGKRYKEVANCPRVHLTPLRTWFYHVVHHDVSDWCLVATPRPSFFARMFAPDLCDGRIWPNLRFDWRRD